MKKCLIILASSCMVLLSMLLSPLSAALAASELKDGTYSVGYTVMKAEGNAVSMANDYWLKPAKLIVKNGKITVQMKIKNSDWVTEFKVPGNGGYVDTQVISKDKAQNTRTVQFAVSSLAKPIKSKIHVTVKSADYDHDYTIQLKFDTGSIQQLGTSGDNSKDTEAAAAGSSSSNKEKTNSSQSKQAEANPQTGDSNKAGWMILLIVVSGGLLARQFAIRNKRV
ncbi:heme uptake protein IsdC [Bacillus sonorensis]|uniref:heme uptake protein IsdC n=1 Tax=Bacillus sonorensis TaxID=119858 RepID=UPI000498325B|nr:heme uptake protein IsdC [Bacillus sonorensis]MBG9916094.1 cell surface protein [Bacillus sonorensis]MCF7617659.1 heme uptake protein IsdC [Bacillus sonorensis]MCY7856377.1 heme uptake protein IsdC [Bacillus sonorensis]MCY8025916.1 heme uptake protein IsdC [Bacillus sonorensis]MCY8034899.1 heme uptake protein IsdC [Bacillus sonorensis]